MHKASVRGYESAGLIKFYNFGKKSIECFIYLLLFLLIKQILCVQKK